MKNDSRIKPFETYMELLLDPNFERRTVKSTDRRFIKARANEGLSEEEKEILRSDLMTRKNLTEREHREEYDYPKLGTKRKEAEIDQLKLPLLPNIDLFETRYEQLEPILVHYGIEKKIRKILYTEGVNHKPNNYLIKQYNRMIRCVKRKDLTGFWKIANLMYQRSDVFMIANMSKVNTLTTWYKDLSWRKMKRALAKANVIRRTKDGKVNLTRVHIEKGDGRWRPLGVPALEWRIISRMLLTLLLIWNPNRSKSQHGYIPRRGLGTAWKTIIKHVLGKDNIYEFDLRKFFDSVNIIDVLQLMARKGMEKKDLRMWMEIFTSDAKKGCLTNVKEEEKNLEQEMEEFLKDQGESWTERNSGIMKGLPQGLGVSPFLSTLLIDDILEGGIIMYADDGLIYGKSKEKVEKLREKFERKLSKLGITIAEEKSGWVKEAGEWKKPLKFLGITYEGKADLLKITSRKGVNCELEWKVDKESRGKYIEDLKGRKVRLEDVLKYSSYYSKYLDVMIARGFNNNQEITEGTDQLRIRKDSFMGINKVTKMSLANVSSAANYMILKWLEKLPPLCPVGESDFETQRQMEKGNKDKARIIGIIETLTWEKDWQNKLEKEAEASGIEATVEILERMDLSGKTSDEELLKILREQVGLGWIESKVFLKAMKMGLM